MKGRPIVTELFPMERMQKARILKKELPLENIQPTRGAFTTCTETFGNGVQTGTATTTVTVRQIQRVLHRVSTVCFAVAVGATLRAAVALRIGLGAIQSAGSSATGSGLFCPQFVEAKFKQASPSPEKAERKGRELITCH